MIVWLLLMVILEGGPTAPLEIFPPTSEGEQACRDAAKELTTMIRNPVDLKCERYTLAPMRGAPDE